MRGAVFILLLLGMTACDRSDDKKEQGKPTSARLRSSKLNAAGLMINQSVVLTNVTGMADSVGLNFSQTSGSSACGFNVWSANSQTGRSGMEGRSYEEYNLASPVTWKSQGAGLQGDCESATVAQIESYFTYMDLHMTVNGSAKIVRAYMSQQLPFEAGDLVIKNGSDLSWYDSEAEVLIPSTSERPAKPARFNLTKEVPWYDNNGTQKIIMMEFRINADQGYIVDKNTGFVEIDVDFSKAGISAADTSSDAGLLSTISLPFLEPGGGSGLLSASLTVSENAPVDAE